MGAVAGAGTRTEGAVTAKGKPPPSKPPRKPVNTRPIGKPPTTGR